MPEAGQRPARARTHDEQVIGSTRKINERRARVTAGDHPLDGQADWDASPGRLERRDEPL